MILLSLIAAAYVYLRAVHPTSWKWSFKLTVGVVLLLTGGIFIVLRQVGGGLPFAPDLPAWFLLTYSGAYMLLMIYMVLLLVGGELAGLLFLAVPRWRRMESANRRRLRNRANALLFAVAAISCAVGMYSALCPPRVTEVKLTLPVSKPLRLALLSDLHVDPVKDAHFVQGIVDRTLAQHPDIIVFTGDFVDGSVQQRYASMQPLTRLHAPLGVYAVPGNHEYYSGQDEWFPALRHLGLRMLNNEHVVLPEHGVVLAGVTDPAARVFGAEQPDVAKALRGAPSGLPVILLAHQPRLAPEAEEHGVALQLSGHTHGGLVLGLHWLVEHFNCGYSFGLYRRGSMLLYVSPGTSLWTTMPLRLGIPSEITLMTISPPTSPSTRYEVRSTK